MQEGAGPMVRAGADTAEGAAAVDDLSPSSGETGAASGPASAALPRSVSGRPALDGGLFLHAGFAVLLLVTAAFTVLLTVETAQSRREVTDLVQQADRSTLLIGRTGRSLARLRAVALEALAKPRPEDVTADDLRRLQRFERELEADLAEVEPLLTSPDEIAAWEDAALALREVRVSQFEAFAAVRAGERGRALTILDQVSARSRRLQTDLDALARINEAESAALLASADERLVRVAWSTALLGTFVALAVASVWRTVVVLQRRQRRELARYVDRLEQTNRDLDAFAARAAHDLRNVLAPIAGAAYLVRSGRPEHVEKVAEGLERVSERGNELIDALLELAQVRTEAHDAVATPLAAALQATLAELDGLRQRSAVEVAVEVPPDLAVDLPAGLLHLVLRNVVGNALKFLDGCPERRVRIAARREPPWCVVDVEDTGPGIASEALPRLFEPFYRAPDASQPGLGLGLAAVARALEARGGRVEACSTPGRGARFTLHLRLAA